MMQSQCNGGQCNNSGSSCNGQGFHDWHGFHGCNNYGYEDKKREKMHEFMETVKCAKESLLEEKIKAKLEAKIGKKLDKIADLAVEMLMSKWEMKKEKMVRKQAMISKFESLMSDDKKV